MFDFLIIGAGLFGATFARQFTDAGQRCLLIEKRLHIAGNCFTTQAAGITVHQFGPHFFHTNSRRLWDYVNNLVPFHPYTHRGSVRHGETLFSFPINLKTLQQLWNVNSPEEGGWHGY